MGEDEAFIKLFNNAIIGFLILLVLCVGSCQTTNYHIGKAIENGTHPYAARCAFDVGDSATCALVATGENNNGTR